MKSDDIIIPNISDVETINTSSSPRGTHTIALFIIGLMCLSMCAALYKYCIEIHKYMHNYRATIYCKLLSPIKRITCLSLFPKYVSCNMIY